MTHEAVFILSDRTDICVICSYMASIHLAAISECMGVTLRPD